MIGPAIQLYAQAAELVWHAPPGDYKVFCNLVIDLLSLECHRPNVRIRF